PPGCRPTAEPAACARLTPPNGPEERPPFFQAAVAKPPQPHLHPVRSSSKHQFTESDIQMGFNNDV
ncbi:MAG: hypothetical protein KK476_09200, partial [Sinorhizobium fredii]|nr:hypothetical protein [Sinorhizobium fredii]